MIVKCNNHGNAGKLTEYILKPKGDETVEPIAHGGGMFNGLTPDDFRLSAKEMQMFFSMTKGKYPCYHVQMAPGKNESLTPEQITYSVNAYLKYHKFTDRHHMATTHNNPDGSMHIHMQISRVNPETGKLDPNKMWRDTNDKIRGHLEETFDHVRTPQRNPRRDQIKVQMTALYTTSKRPQDFVAGVNKLGYVVAYGGSRNHPWQLVDSMAVGHNLTSLILIDADDDKKKKLTNKQLVDYMRGMRFPTLNEAIALQRVKQKAYEAEVKKADQEAKAAQKAEQFKYSPDSRSAKKQSLTAEVGNDPLSKKQDAAIAAINQFRKQEEEKEYKKKLAAMKANLEAMFSEQKDRER